MNNPFPDPNQVDPEINNEIKTMIVNLVNSKKLDLFTMLSYFEDKLKEKDQKRALISAYYITNTVLNSNKTNSEKEDIISLLSKGVV